MGFGYHRTNKWIAFYDQRDNALYKVPRGGGSPIKLAELAYGGFYPNFGWGPNGSLISLSAEGLVQIPAQGGTPKLITHSEEGIAHGHPWMLPEEDALLFNFYNSTGMVGDLISTAQVAHLSLASGEIKILFEGGSRPRLTPSGHLLVARQDAIWSAVFDPEVREIVGEPIPVLTGLYNQIEGSSTPYSVSREGTLVHLMGEGDATSSELVSVGRSGLEETLGAPPRNYSLPTLSPDGQRVAVAVGNLIDSDIWVYSRDRGTSQQLTFDGGFFPYWTPDGSEVHFTRFPGGHIWSKKANGTGTARQLTSGPRWQIARQYGVFHECDPGLANCDIGVFSPEQETGVELIVQTEHLESMPSVSPGGQWLAYTSNESGQEEVYMHPYPNVDDSKRIVSTAGGMVPRWSLDGRELYYISLANQVMAVPNNADDGIAFEPGTPVALFDASKFRTPIPTFPLVPEPTPDGQRFLFTRPVTEQTVRIVVVENFFDELERLEGQDFPGHFLKQHFATAVHS